MHRKPLANGLADLARSNQQTRDAALLRATTELFAREQKHDRDQIHRYEELATHFLPKVAVADRAFVAEQLAECADAPRPVISMLARDVMEVAAPIIRRSPALGALDLLSVIAATGVDHHRLIARRPGLADEVKRALRLTGDADVLDCLGETGASPAAGSERTTTSPLDVRPPRQRPGGRAHDARDPADFLRLDRPARLRMLADYATRPPARQYAGTADRLDRAFRSILGAAKIVGHARGGQIDALIAAIAEGLELHAGFVSAVISDTTGEALAVLLKALHLDDVQAQQVFLLATPAGRDAAAFFPLADLYSGMEARVAETICELWRTSGGGRAAGHQPYVADGGAQRRAGINEAPARNEPATREASKRA